MRVLSISTLFPNPVRPQFGIFVGNQMRAVRARGEVELTVISPIGIPPWPLNRRPPFDKLGTIPETSDTAGMPVHYPKFTTIPRIGSTSNPGRIVKAILPLVRQLHGERPFDLIDAQFFFPDGPAAAAISDALGLPLTIKARGADIHHWGKRPAARKQMLEASQRAAGMLAVSEALRMEMITMGMPGERISLHYTGLDRERFRPIERAAARALVSAIPDLGIWSQGKLILTPGALIPRKGQRLVIGALAKLSGVHLALAGHGEDEPALRSLAKQLGVSDRVQFLGQVSHDLLPQLMSAADVLVLPSASEGLANVWIEALACGTPLVIPDIGGAREVMQDQTAGRLVERDVDSIAAAVTEILANPPSQEDVAANVERFGWGINAANLVDFWSQVLAGSGAET